MNEKQGIVTFKAPESLREALQSIPNKSEFIRNAVTAALDGVCPLCNGTGILLPNQREHWRRFAANHFIQECEECRAKHLVCSHSIGGGTSGHPHGEEGS
jgi:hypothetical protein